MSGSSSPDPPVCRGKPSSCRELDTGETPHECGPLPCHPYICLPVGAFPHQCSVPKCSPNPPHDSLQGACPWPSRAHPKQKSAAPTTRMGRVASPTCLCFLVTTASWSSTMSSTFQAAPSPPGSQVSATWNSVRRRQVAGWAQSSFAPRYQVTISCQVMTRCACPT